MSMSGNKDIILSVRNFSAGFEREGEILRAVDDISFENGAFEIKFTGRKIISENL